MAEIEVKNRKAYRVWNGTTKKWDELRFLTDASSVDARDGKSLEEKIGEINGITTDINVKEKGYALDATVAKELKNNLGGYVLTTKDGKIAYYKESEGADSAVPFKSGVSNAENDNSVNIKIPEGYDKAYVLAVLYRGNSGSSASYPVCELISANNTININTILDEKDNNTISGSSKTYAFRYYIYEINNIGYNGATMTLNITSQYGNIKKWMLVY